MAHGVSAGCAYAGGNIGGGGRPGVFLGEGILGVCGKFPGQGPGLISLGGLEGRVGWWRTLSGPIACRAPISLTWMCDCPAAAGHSGI